MTSRWTTWSVFRSVWPLLASAACLLAFWYVGLTFCDGYVLDLGSMTAPAPKHAAFLFYWTLFGSVASGFMFLGLARAIPCQPASNPGPADRAAGDRWWLAAGVAAAVLIPVAIRLFLLRGASLTDDESAYRFMGQVLATGRLWADSHALKEFFDRVFMINDGKFYGQYFIGWPALMVPGVWVGAVGYMNAVYSGLTVLPLFAIAGRMGGSAAARVALLLFLASPMLMVGAATEMSHPSCFMALAWTFYFQRRSRERPEAWWTHAGVAFFFGLAFLIRPTSALGVGLPVLLAWLWTMRQAPAAVRARAIVAFGLPAVALAAVFFGVNTAQNGSPLATSYARMQAYMKEVNYQNVGWSSASPPTSLSDYMLPNRHVGRALASSAIAIVRLVYDLFATPLALVLLAFAWALRPARLAWASVVCFMALHLFTADSGVDTFGPVHYYEMSLPLLLLAGAGAARAAAAGTREEGRGSRDGRLRPGIVVASLVVVSLAGFVPVRLGTVKRIADNVNMPADAIRQARISNAVIFTAGLFTPQDCIAPTRHFLYFRPNNDPSLTGDVLWVNHLGWEVDHELMPYFPGRVGYLLQWEGCRAKLTRLLSGPKDRM
jgi:hypothetical protein